ncbi:MAG: Uma2 family endonuclease [Thermomicrobiales bacterium]
MPDNVAKQYRFNSEQLMRIWEGKVLGELCRVELLDGQLIDLGEITGPHMWTVNRASRALHNVNREIGWVSTQCPLIFDWHTTFLPDIVLLRRDDMTNDAPTVAEALIVIEVAEKQAIYERTIKLPHYAEANVAEMWICDLSNGRIERYTEPRNGKYQQLATVGRGEQIASTVLPDLIYDVATILGPTDQDDQ